MLLCIHLLPLLPTRRYVEKNSMGVVGLLGWSRDYPLNPTVFLPTVVRESLRRNHGKRPRRVDSPPVRAHSGIWRTSWEHVGSSRLAGEWGAGNRAPKDAPTRSRRLH
jgi:hypothetical protein